MAMSTSFEGFVGLRYPALVRLCWALTGDRAQAEDLAQEALQRLWRKWEHVSLSGDPWPYVQTIAINLARSWRARRRHLATIEPSYLPAAGPDAQTFVENRDEVAQWLSALPRGQRLVVVLRYLSDLSIDETATVLGCSPGTVKSQSARALSSLRAVVSKPVQEKELGGS